MNYVSKYLLLPLWVIKVDWSDANPCWEGSKALAGRQAVKGYGLKYRCLKILVFL